MPTCSAVKIYTMQNSIELDDDGNVVNGGGGDPCQELAALAREFQANHPGLGWRAALHQVQLSERGQNLMRRYNASGAPRGAAAREPSRSYSKPIGNDERASASRLLDVAARKLMTEDGSLSYGEATRRAMKENPAAAKTWTGR